MKTKIKKLASHLNDHFRTALPKAVKQKFGIEVVTEWSFIESNIRTYRPDGVSLTHEQFQFIFAYEKGYLEAMNQCVDTNIQ